MNKGELVSAMAENSGLSIADCEKALNAFINSTKNCMQSGDKISLIGFGTFSVTERSARKGRNPQTGKEIDIPAKKSVKFKAGSGLDLN